ncbi:TIGR03067 domain-containing protein [Rosistilla oblonga]|uniref:TIGR03067 domain-containing protein n=1 Tax=Rosistilla oblonga TaxID=2527990 RepID=UPI003A970EAD
MSTRFITRLTALTLLATCSPIALADDGKKDAKLNDSVMQRLQGRWEVVAGVNQGRELSEAELKGTYNTVATNTITTYDRNEHQRFRAVFSIDSAEDPIQINMTSVPQKSTVAKRDLKVLTEDIVAAGILKFEGDDKWTLCYALPGNDRPTKFESPEGSKVMLFHLVRRQGDPVPDGRSASRTK